MCTEEKYRIYNNMHLGMYVHIHKCKVISVSATLPSSGQLVYCGRWCRLLSYSLLVGKEGECRKCVTDKNIASTV